MMTLLSHMLANGWKQSSCIHSLVEAKKFAKSIASFLVDSEIILLRGDLGSGKTHFVKNLVEALGGNPLEVTSPTFNLMHIYETEKMRVYHFDLYRLTSSTSFNEAGFDDYISNDGICCIEWPEKIEDRLKDISHLNLVFKHLANGKREVSFFQ